MKHVIVVGSGIAGLIAAHEMGQRHAVTLVTKAQLAESNTRYAQGGIAAAMASDDTVAEHIADTLRAGVGLCDEKAVQVLCSEGPRRIRDLIRLGVAFDYREGELERGLEAAHTRARVLHAGGDATGLTIELALVRQVRATPNVRVLEHTFACDLVMRNDTVAGLLVQREDGTRELLSADAVVLASGGAGQMYRYTTNPAVATGDGVAIALRVGAQLADVEFYQFHPTLLAMEGAPFLISEAVRGEGAVLLDMHGRRFMQAIDERAELAPRDVVARGIAMQMAMQDGAPVLLDVSRLGPGKGAEFLAKRFPTIDAACRARGLDWSREAIPVTPAAHYWMGGVRTDLFGRTSVRGLYAVGEVACTGVHGANRLASNSLLESLVFAWRCAHLLLSDSPLVESGHGWPDWLAEGDAVHRLPVEALPNASIVDRETLRAFLWEHAGIQRNGDALRKAALQVALWTSPGEDVQAQETENLLQVARCLVAAALLRPESRGAHYREDFLERSDAFAHSRALARTPATHHTESRKTQWN